MPRKASEKTATKQTIKEQKAKGEVPGSRPARTRGKGKSRSGAAENRREEIIAAAAQLFAEHGFEATSVRLIAKEVGILSGSLYHHFETKEEILHEILGKAMGPLTEKSIRVSQADVDAEQKLVALVLLRFIELTAEFKSFRIIYNNRNYFRGREEFSYVETSKTTGFETMESVLVEGVKSGYFKDNLDIHLTIGTIFRLLSGGVDWFISGSFVERANSPEDYSLDAVIDYHLDFLLSAVRSSKRKSKPVPKTAAEQLLACL